MAFKNRKTFMEYYWENMKVDMSKVLLSDTINPIIAKVLSARIFAMHKDIKQKVLDTYSEYCRQVFIVKYLEWRWQRVRSRRLHSTFDWKKEIPRIK